MWPSVGILDGDARAIFLGQKNLCFHKFHTGMCFMVNVCCICIAYVHWGIDGASWKTKCRQKLVRKILLHQTCLKCYVYLSNATANSAYARISFLHQPSRCKHYLFCLDLSAKGRGDPMPFATIASVPQWDFFVASLLCSLRNFADTFY